MLVYAGDGVLVPMSRIEQIYFHAAQLFVEKGFAVASMSDIAEAVGITKAATYHFVPNKEELLFNLMNFGLDILEDDVVKPASTIEDPAGRLTLIVKNHLLNVGRMKTETGNPFTIFLDEPGGLSPKYREAIDARKRTYFEFVRESIIALRDAGHTHDVDPSVATFSLLGMIIWMSRWAGRRNRMSLDQIADEMTGIALRGILKPAVVPTPYH